MDSRHITILQLSLQDFKWTGSHCSPERRPRQPWRLEHGQYQGGLLSSSSHTVPRSPCCGPQEFPPDWLFLRGGWLHRSDPWRRRSHIRSLCSGWEKYIIHKFNINTFCSTKSESALIEINLFPGNQQVRHTSTGLPHHQEENTPGRCNKNDQS